MFHRTFDHNTSHQKLFENSRDDALSHEIADESDVVRSNNNLFHQILLFHILIVLAQNFIQLRPCKIGDTDSFRPFEKQIVNMAQARRVTIIVSDHYRRVQGLEIKDSYRATKDLLIP